MIFFYFMLLSKFPRIQADSSFSSTGVFPPHYDKFHAPHNKGNPAHVYVDLRIMDVDRIDEGLMEFSIQCYIVEYWRDARLNLSGQSIESNQLFPAILVELIWTPDLVFDNAKTGVLFSLSVPNTHVRVSEGGFLRSTRYNLVIGCQMNFHYYPMDTQECFLKIALLANPEHKVTLHWADEVTNPKRMAKSIRFTNEIQPLKYKILPPRPYKAKELWTAGNYTYLYANFTFVRRISGSLLNVYVPSMLVVCLSWISFWLEVASAPARITLGVTSLLTLVTQVVQARNGLPAISYMTAMDVWLFVCLVLVFSSLLEYAFTYQAHLKIKKRHMICDRQQQSSQEMRQRKSPRIRVQSNFRMTTVQMEDRNFSNELALDRLCRKLFPLVFVAFGITYWTCYLLFN